MMFFEAAWDRTGTAFMAVQEQTSSTAKAETTPSSVAMMPTRLTVMVAAISSKAAVAATV